MPSTQLVPLHLAVLGLALSLSFSACGPGRTRVYFSPQGGCSEAVVSVLERAEKEVRIAMFALSRKPIESAILRARDRGVDVRLVLDRSQARTVRKTWERLRAAGVEVKFSTGNGYMHHKFAVADGSTVATGSFNWTGRGESKNHENLLVLEDAGLARQYLAEWHRLPCDAEAPPAR